VATPVGGYRIGNSAAPVKVIEFFSLTCPHCRHFTEVGLPPLKSGYISGGKVSLELRNFVLNAPDLAASILMRCASPALAVGFFDAVFADQQAVFAGAQNLGQADADRILAMPLEERAGGLARAAKIDSWFIAHGLAASRSAACLADPKGEKRLVAIREDAVKTYDVGGTPAFVVNGSLVKGTGWDDLEPAIKAALAAQAGVKR